MQALFGQEKFVFQRDNLNADPEMQRVPKGLWFGPKGVRYRRVSGVMIGFDIKPWTFAVRELIYYVNPWAHSLVEGCIYTLPTAVPANGKMEWNKGAHPKEILGFSKPYPGLD